MRAQVERASEDWLNDGYQTERVADRTAGQALMAAKIIAMTYEGLCEAADIEPEADHAEAA